MKTLTSINWVMVGLYGLLIIFLLGTNFSPNNDAAGRGMLGGIIVILLIFVGVLTFLNFRDSQATKITAIVLGGIPMLFISYYLFLEFQREKPEETQSITPIKRTDKELAQQTVLDFLNWYQTNFSLINQIKLVDQEPGQVYAVNAQQAERYLIYLKSSELLTNYYINEWRTYFKERQEGFRLSQQQEGPPTGFEYDLVVLSQEPSLQLSALKSLKIKSISVDKNQAIVSLQLLDDYEFRLEKQHGRWLINEILNLSVE
ncbi:hypothetical protein GCM10028807_45860 [Spirosoma daeguense]